MIAQMDYVGIGMAVLHRGHVYGQLNDYIGECVKKYSHRFVGLAQINEAGADHKGEIEVLEKGHQGTGTLWFDV